MNQSQATILSLSTSKTHTFSKPPVSRLKLIANHGIEGDAHAGTTVQHLSRLHIKPPPPNLRQVHIMPVEVLQRISVSGRLGADQQKRLLEPGALGQNITTQGIDLLSLPVGTELRFVNKDGQVRPVLVLTGLRNPCKQIDKFVPGLMEKFLVRSADGKREIQERLAGVMCTVKTGGVLERGMGVEVVRPARFVALGVV
ncbi:hypothetical protein BDW74DRAFT_31870 [Aspergillus multicolor]|uniref:MOSC domain-containing protein n=1 Tax=Aspergillus multicolor TaxID=41759 RepID=UPI003CCD0A22